MIDRPVATSHQIAAITVIFLRANARFEGVKALMQHGMIGETEAAARREMVTVEMDTELGLRRPV